MRHRRQARLYLHRAQSMEKGRKQRQKPALGDVINADGRANKQSCK